MYKINSEKRYEVTFVKDTARFKTGDKTMAGMVLAIKFLNWGMVKADREFYADAKAAGCDELIEKQKTVE